MDGLGQGRSRTKRTKATREQIVKAATALLAQKGYDATSLDEVAAAAGVTKGTIYYHFDSKEAVYGAVISPEIDRNMREVEEILGGARSPREALIEVLRLQTRGARVPAERYLYYQELLPLSDDTRRALRQRENRYEALVADVIRRGQELGEVVAGDPKILALVYIGAAVRTARWYKPDGRVPPDEFWDTIATLLLNGLLTQDWRTAPAALPDGADAAVPATPLSSAPTT